MTMPIPSRSFDLEQPPPNRVCRPGSALLAAWLSLGFFLVTDIAAQDRGRAKPNRQKRQIKVPGADLQPRAVFAKFPDWVACVAYSPDGATLAAGSYEAVKLFDLAAKKEIATLAEPAGMVRAVVFARDGKQLVTGSYQSLAIWNLEMKKRERAVKGPAGYLTSLAFSPGGEQLAGASDDETVRLWDFDSGEQRGSLQGITQPALCVALSPDGRLLAVATGDATRPTKRGGAYIFAADGRLIHSLVGHERVVSAVVFSPDGTTLATGGADETIRLWDVGSGKEIKTLEGHTRPVNSLAFVTDGRFLFSVSGGRAVDGNELKLWDVSQGKDLATVPAHEAPISHVALSPDGNSLATASYDKSVKVWDVAAILLAAGQSVPAAEGADSEYRPEPPPLPEAEGVPEQGAEKTRRQGDKETRRRPAKDVSDLMPTAESGMTGLARLPFRVANSALRTSSPCLSLSLSPCLAAFTAAAPDTDEDPAAKELRIGMIGLDTSHAIAFTQLLNQAERKDHVPGGKVVMAYPKGSLDIESSTKRVPEYTQQVRDMGVEIVESIDGLASSVDAVLLETNDGRPHLEQALPALKAGKPVFIDKPIAGSLTDAVAIFEAARRYKAPVFSSSSLRYAPGAQALRRGKIGEIKGCDAYSPCALEATHPDLFWYGIHGVESLFTVMGPGCETVSRVSTPGIDEAVGVWKGGRVGTFRGIRSDQGGGQGGYGGTAFGTKGIEQIGDYGGYRPLVVEIIQFFQTGKSPVVEEETLEIYAFMEAADESKRQGNKPVTLESVLRKAREAASKKLTGLGVPAAK
jgi:WD40 repeat protein